MTTIKVVLILLITTLSSCTPGLMRCYLTFTDYEKSVEFDFSKEELKNRIIEAYSYDQSLLLQNFGKTLIENEQINNEYRKSVDVWLDKYNWDQFKSKIISNTPDTLNIIIGKHFSWQRIKFTVVV